MTSPVATASAMQKTIAGYISAPRIRVRVCSSRSKWSAARTRVSSMWPVISEARIRSASTTGKTLG